MSRKHLFRDSVQTVQIENSELLGKILKAEDVCVEIAQLITEFDRKKNMGNNDGKRKRREKKVKNSINVKKRKIEIKVKRKSKKRVILNMSDDNEFDEQLAPKRAKRICKFRKEWLQCVQYKDWLKKSTKNVNTAYCNVCCVDFTIKHRGVSSVKQHSSSKTHILKQKSNKSIQNLNHNNSVNSAKNQQLKLKCQKQNFLPNTFDKAIQTDTTDITNNKTLNLVITDETMISGSINSEIFGQITSTAISMDVVNKNHNRVNCVKSDNELDEQLSPKRAKILCKFKKDWLQCVEYKDWLKKSTKNENNAYCDICCVDFTIKYRGVSSVKQHSSSKTHILKQKSIKSNKNHNNININSVHYAKYFCIFCSQTFSDTESATRHYKCHINYYPIECLICNESLTDLQSFVTHHSEEHSNELKGRYKKKDRPELDTWIELFLLFQTTITGTAQPLQSSQSSHLSYASCVDCPVCVKMIEANNVDTNELVLNPRYPDFLSLSVHLHQHLVYYRYECALCMANGKSMRVTSRDSVEAVSHLNEHQLDTTIDINTGQLDEQLTKYFPQTLCIPEIEKLIVSKIFLNAKITKLTITSEKLIANYESVRFR